jgi:hypothetical protein
MEEVFAPIAGEFAAFALMDEELARQYAEIRQRSEEVGSLGREADYVE